WNSQFPIAGLRLRGFPFVKKSLEPIHSDWRDQILRAVSDAAIAAPDPAVIEEMSERQGQGVKHTPHWVARAASGP
ncbi:hypothetical protein, partial [Tabrizicola sp.]|uniref:hypothetical protein n=1 Tax=Tabrizicola sp. TaxID=2005166 RepID=UPI003F370A26